MLILISSRLKAFLEDSKAVLVGVGTLLQAVEASQSMWLPGLAMLAALVAVLEAGMIPGGPSVEKAPEMGRK